MQGKAGPTLAIEHAQSDLEQALRLLAELPAVDTDHLSYAAHALNNYLMVVSTIAHVLRAGIGKAPDAEVANRLDALNHATRLMQRMVRQFYGSDAVSPLTLLFAPVDLTMIARAASDEYQPLAREKSITIELDMPGQVIVWADRVAVGAVLDNLLSNAVKYSRIGGTVRVATRAMSMDGVCAVSDSGPGISDGESARLFTRGGKLSSRPTGGEDSTGYGLAIAKDLVDGLRGRIWFENLPTGGATFSFAVPLYEPALHNPAK